MKFLVKISTFILAFLGLGLNAQELSFDAYTNKNQVRIGEVFEVTFLLTDKGSGYKYTPNDMKIPRDINLFEVIGRINVGGSLSSKRGIRYRLKATSSGLKTISRAKMKIGGRSYYTNQIRIKVLENKPGSSALTGGASFSQRNDLYLRVEIDKDDPYIQEQVLVTVKAFAASTQDLRRIKGEIKVPSINGVKIHKVDRVEGAIRQEIINGEVFVTKEVARFILFPQIDGLIQLGPFKTQIVISTGGYTNAIAEVSSNKENLRVRSLPEPKPVDFTGAVGVFLLKINPGKLFLKENESTELEVEIIGKGNLDILKIPKLKADKGLEVYKPKYRTVFEARAGGLIGKVSANFTLVPQYGGKFKTKPYRFTYFNPDQEKYITEQAEGIKITYRSRVKKPSRTGVLSEEETEKRIEEGRPGKLFKNITESVKSFQSTWVKKLKTHFQKNETQFYFSLSLLSVFLFFLFASTKFFPKITSFFRERKKKQYVKELAQLEIAASSEDRVRFLDEAEKLINLLVVDVLGIQPAKLSKEEAKKGLEEKYKKKEAKSWVVLYERIQQEKYSPKELGSLDLKETYIRLNKLVKSIIKNK